MKYFEINLEESKSFSVPGRKRWQKKPVVKVCVKYKIPKGVCMLGKIRDQSRSWKLYQFDLEIIGRLNIVRFMD